MSLYFLNSGNFEVKNNQLCCKNSREGEFLLVLYYSPDCPHCGPIIPIFQQLSQSIQGCKFAIMNVMQNRAVSDMSINTSTPIKYVPLSILYYEGIPAQQFKPPYTLANLRNFILQTASKIKGQRANSKSVEPEKTIPPYTVGIPYCDEDSGVCYINFDSAYKSSKAPVGTS